MSFGEPWEVRSYDHLRSFEIRSVSRWWPIASVKKEVGRGPETRREPESRKLAERIVACVNACRDMDDPAEAIESLHAQALLYHLEVDKVAALRETLDRIRANAEVVPDPRMEGATDVYAIPLDDLDAEGER